MKMRQQRVETMLKMEAVSDDQRVKERTEIDELKNDEHKENFR